VELDPALQTAIASCYSSDAADQWHLFLEKNPPHWPALSSYATTLGLAPLLYDAFRRFDESAIPVEILSDLRKQYYDTAGFNMLILQELVALLRSFETAQIDVVVLKGAALVLDVYERLAHRPMIDLDLLIRFEDLDVARAMLEKKEYQEIRPAPFADDTGLVWNEIMLVQKEKKGPAIELHWHLIDNPYYATRLNTESLIERSRQLNVADVSPRVLDLEDQIIHLCCHNLYHHLGRFTHSLVDIAFLVAKYGDEITWEKIIQQAEESDVTLAVGTAILQLSSNWYTSIPESAIEKSSSWKPSNRERFYASSQQSEYLRALRTISALPGVRSKFRYIRGQLLPERPYMMWRYDLGPETSLTSSYMRRFGDGIQGLGRTIRRRRKKP